MISPRDYQQPFLEGIRDAYGHGAQSVLGVAPCGFGKTISFAYMTMNSVNKGVSVGLVAHRGELLDQIGGALTSFRVPHGYIAPKRAPDPLAPAQVCSVQALGRRIERINRNPFGFLIEDEAHHCASGTAHHAVALAHKKKKADGKWWSKILGVTATPERLSGEALQDTFETMVIGPTVGELMDTGALSRYRAYAPTAPDVSQVKKTAGDLDRNQTGEIMDKPKVTGSAVEHYIRLAYQKKAVAFCVSVEHAEHVARDFVAAGIPAASLDGTMHPDIRREILRQFAAGDIWVLTSCDLISEGYDLPGIEVAILLRPTESLVLFIQQVGRALRAVYAAGFDLNTERGRLDAIQAGPKQFAIILDHAGNIARHGLPDDDRIWSLQGRKARKASGYRVIPTCTCGKCFRTFRPSRSSCPFCDFDRDILGRQIRVVDGYLEEIDPNLVKEARKLEQAAITKRVNATRGIDGLADLAIELGYSEAWVWNKHKFRGNPDFPYRDAVVAVAKARARINA